MGPFSKRMYLYFVAAALALILLVAAGCGGSSRLARQPQPDTPGLTQALAQLDAAAPPAGVDPAVFDQLKNELKRVLEEQGGIKHASIPPVDDGSATHLKLETIGSQLSWPYYSTGDYDQNGEVNINDLTPLGVHFGETGDFDPNSIQAVVDGNHDGEINIQDVTPIGMNFHSMITGYDVFSSTSFADLPHQNDSPNGSGALKLGNVPLLSGTGAGRLQFAYTLASNPAGTLYWVRPSDGSDVGTPSNATVPLGDTLTPDGGAVQLDDIVFSIPPHSLVDDVKFTHSLVAAPGGYPSDFTPAGQAHDIGIDHPELLNAPVILQIPYDDTGMGADEANVMVLHYDGANYSPTTIMKQDTANNIVTIDSRVFSDFVVGSVAGAAIAALASSYDVGFSPNPDGWDINNFGSYFSTGGNCLGMSAYACWFFENRGGNLWGHYSTAGGAPTSIAHLTATRAMMAQSQYWALKQFDYEQTLGAAITGSMIKYDLAAFGEPLILVLTGAPGGHACVVYGWDATGFRFYDVNFMGVEQHLNWSSAAGFGNYPGGFAAPGFTNFGYVAKPSWGRTEDFADLTAEAEGGFTSSADISLTTPTPDEEIDARDAHLTGSLSGSLNALSILLCYVKGLPQWVPVAGGAFDSTIPINNGPNTLILLAGVDISQQSNWYKNCATLIRNVKGTQPDADLLATLTWNQDSSDVDLYVTEPGGETSWYLNHDTSNGMSLDFDNVNGYGPEHISVSTAEGDTVVPGPYVICVHYYADHGGGAAGVSGNVAVVTNEGKPTQTVQNYPFAIGTANSDNATPGSNGPEWVDITTVTLIPLPPPGG